MPRFRGACLGVCLDWNSGAFGKASDGVGKINVFVIFDEGENIAAFVAAEAMIDLLAAD